MIELHTREISLLSPQILPLDQSAERRPVRPRLRAHLIDEARALGLDLSRLAEEALLAAIQHDRGRRWTEENRKAIEHHSRRIERDGMLNADLIEF